MYTDKNNDLIKTMSNESVDEDQAELWNRLNPEHPLQEKAGENDVPEHRRG